MRSRSSRTSSTLVLEAASISIRSRKRPALTAWQGSHWLHGRSPGDSARQLAALASSRAHVVLPDHLLPALGSPLAIQDLGHVSVVELRLTGGLPIIMKPGTCRSGEAYEPGTDRTDHRVADRGAALRGRKARPHRRRAG